MRNLNSNTTQEPHIIVVDNSHDDCALFQNCFQHLNWHHQVKMLPDADALFDLLDATPHPKLLPTLIILDYNTPRLGGETALILLKKDERYQRIPVGIYAASINDRKEKQMLSLGAQFYRKKPTTIDGMHWDVVELIELAKSNNRNQQMAIISK